MDMLEIENTIEELENGPTTFDNAIKLSALYSVRDNLNSDTEKELEDILPQFRMYVAVKKGYQLKELTADDLRFAMRSMCRDIEEFIETLYNNTELQEERDTIHNMLQSLLEAF
jgi:hypothetical protein